MILLDVLCHARQHDTPAAHRAGCVCPPPDPTPPRARKTKPRQLPPGQWPRTGSIRRTEPELDWIAAERILAGNPPERTTVADRIAALDLADSHGASARQVAIRLRCSTRTVQRRRAERRTT